MKKGVMEFVDLIVVNKVEDENCIKVMVVCVEMV